MTDPVTGISPDKWIEFFSNNTLGALCLLLFYFIRRDSDRRDQERKEDFERKDKERTQLIEQYREDIKETRESNEKLTTALNELTLSIKILIRTERRDEGPTARDPGFQRGKRNSF